ncbi:hypothetical protein J3E72DRAFT_264440 [Bipolaris maydis]|nr:hypothetical protein J3E72DRAFT_264440 [Bipolaris maydis]
MLTCALGFALAPVLSGIVCGMTLCGHEFPSDCCCAVQAGFQQDTCLLSCLPEKPDLVHSSIAARVGHGIQRLNGTSRKFLDHDPLRFPQPEMRLATSDHPHTVLRQRCNPGVRTTAAC